MDRVGTQAVLSQDKEQFQLRRNGLLFRTNSCNTRVRGCYGFAQHRRAFFAALIVALVVAAAPYLGIGVNLSRSSPRGLYRVTDDPLARGALVTACLPAAVASFGRTRGYLGLGDCPGSTQPILKTVGGLAGDIVELTVDGVAVNGVPLLARALEAADSAARPLPHVGLGSYRVGADEVWLFGLSHSNSWDSRYFGAVPLTAVRSAVEPVVTFERQVR